MYSYAGHPLYPAAHHAAPVKYLVQAAPVHHGYSVINVPIYGVAPAAVVHDAPVAFSGKDRYVANSACLKKEYWQAQPAASPSRTELVLSLNNPPNLLVIT